MGPGGRGAALLVLLGALGALAVGGAPPRYSSRIVHTAAGAVRGVIREVAARQLEPVEAFLGVPYGGRPERLRAAPPPAPWSGTRLADTSGPACPQRPPVLGNRSAALARMPLGRYLELETALPLLVNQSEDCLSLDLYVPGSGSRGVEAPYAVVVWAGGASHEWGAAALHDGAALTARGRLMVVCVSVRRGLLGFLTTGRPGDAATAAGGAAVLDLLAALRWLRAHAAVFGGDPGRVTLVAHRAGVATASALLALPTARGLVHRALFISGSPLSPGALAPDPMAQRDYVARTLLCQRTDSTDPEEHWLQSCISDRPLSALTLASPPPARFLPGWAPSPPALSRALHASDAFLQCALAVVVCTTESYDYFSEDEIRHGFEEEHRNRVLRTFVRNVFRWHRNEILAAVRNEYTDWERPVQHPINIRDATLEALSDGAGAAPAVRLARLHARRGAPTFLAHFAHVSRTAPQPARLGSAPGDAEHYFLGLPLLAGGRNRSRADVAVAETAVSLLAALAKGGAPSPPGGPPWPRYELSSQRYLSVSSRPRGRSHYRAHRLALWLALLPQLHRPDAAPARHHRLQHDDPDMFAGELFPEPEPTEGVEEESIGDGEERVDESSVEECAPPAPPAARPAQPRPEEDVEGTSSYGAALGATVGAGCALLALNAAVLAALYAARGRRQPRPNRRGPRAPPQPLRPPQTLTPPTPLSDQHAPSPRRSTLKHSSESPRAKPAKRVQISVQEISV